MNLIPIGTVTDLRTGRSWSFHVTEQYLADEETRRVIAAYRRAREDGVYIDFVRKNVDQWRKLHSVGD